MIRKIEDIPKILTIFLLLQIFDTSFTMADELRLMNGDHITGRVIAMTQNKLVFKTAYAGKIIIEWHEVLSLTSDSPLTVVVGDNVSLQGTAEPARDGKMRINQDKISESATFDLSEVTEIIPKG